MRDYLAALLPLLLNEAYLLAMTFSLSRRFPGRSCFPLRVTLASVGGAVLTALVALPCIYMQHATDIWFAAACIPQAVFAVLAAWFCHGMRFRDAAFSGSVAVAARHVADQTARAICIAAFGSGAYDCGAAGHAIRAGLYVAVLATVIVIFGKIRPKNAESVVGRFSVFVFPVSLAVTAALDFAGLIIFDFGVIYATVLAVCGIFYGLFMLFAECAFIISRQSEVELSVIRSLWNEDRKHYEMQKESMEMINIKCHDLRHQIRRLRESGSVGEDEMREIENSVYIYDAMFRTGSEVLDVVLSDYSLRCRKSEVMLTCMADGEKIAFMDEMDVYSLFGNMLENALEYEQTVPVKENRFISLTVRAVKGGVSVHTENYFEGDVRVEGGVVETSKKDKNNHGFGMKSMRKIVEKYGGTMDVVIADDMFQVDIRLPDGGSGRERA